MLGEDGPCHEATASVSAMATAAMRIARASSAVFSWQSINNAVTAPCAPHSRRHYRAVAAKKGALPKPTPGHATDLAGDGMKGVGMRGPAGDRRRAPREEDGRCLDGVASLRAIEAVSSGPTAEELNHPGLYRPISQGPPLSISRKASLMVAVGGQGCRGQGRLRRWPSGREMIF